MMKKTVTSILSSLMILAVHGQVAEMNWELDYQIYLKLANDSNYVYDIKDLFHVTDAESQMRTDYVFYPVNPGDDYVRELRQKQTSDSTYKTLWAALHEKIGGGWVHFTNCIAYALETQNLNLEAPLMIRPQTNWKPDPVTESYLRTKKWTYYIPVDQKNAIKEYQIRISEGQAGDLNSLPNGYTNLFKNTKNRQYQNYKANGEYDKIARIDLIKVLLGANYLGEAQIIFVSNAVLESLKNYSATKLPSVIVFDEYEAAAVMSLRADGYQLESVVFKKSANLNDQEMESRKKAIEKIITDINAYNNNSFRKHLGSYYKD